MDPITAMMIVMAAQIAGGAYVVHEQRQLGWAQKSLYKKKARIAEQQAHQAEVKGEREARRYGQKVQAFAGAQKAAYGSSGIKASEGVATEVLLDTERQGQADMQAIRHNAAMEAWGYRQQAKILKKEGKLAYKAAKLQGTMSMISGATQAGSTYLSFAK